jgi:Flp pilus assembly pilin Flp
MGREQTIVRRGRSGELVLVFAADEAGQDVVEYGMLIATIAIVVLMGTMAFGNQIRPWFERLAGMITTVGT